MWLFWLIPNYVFILIMLSLRQGIFILFSSLNACTTYTIHAFCVPPPWPLCYTRAPESPITIIYDQNNACHVIRT
jgi:hypothetical protein